MKFSRFNFQGSALHEIKPHPQIGCNRNHAPLLSHMRANHIIYAYITDSVIYELTMSELRSCVVEAMIHGYHEYQSIWEAEVGESLTCMREPGNVRDPYVPRSRC